MGIGERLGPEEKEKLLLLKAGGGSLVGKTDSSASLSSSRDSARQKGPVLAR